MNTDQTHSPGISSRLPFHYGWVIVFVGTLTVFACLGLGRFALGMLLPSMGADLELNYAQMGYISTANFVGYFAAVLVTGPLSRRFGPRWVITGGLALVGGSMVVVSFAGGFVSVMVLYTATGMGSGAANVPIMGMVSHWFARKNRGKAAGYIAIGSGFAIMFSGLYIPWINSLYLLDGWRISWGTLGLVCGGVAILAGLLLRDDPAEMGLSMVGQTTPPPAAPIAGPVAETAKPNLRAMIIHIGLIYAMFGATYVIYATFIVTTLVTQHGYSEAEAGNLWMWIGLLSLLSGPLFGTLSDKAGRKVALICVFAMQMTAYLLAASGIGGVVLYASIALFGMAAWAIPGIMAALAGDFAGPLRAVPVFGAITLFFGAGQVIGPAVAGILAEQSGSFSGSYLMAAALAATAIGGAAFLHKPAEN